MTNELRVVGDRSAIVSALMFPQSVPRKAFDRAFNLATILVSDATIRELGEVLQRPKFNRYVALAARMEFFAAYVISATKIDADVSIKVCRDPKDNKFLELAVSGNATDRK